MPGYEYDIHLEETLKLDPEIKSSLKNQMFLCYFQKRLMIEAIDAYKEVITNDSSLVNFNDNAIKNYESSGTNAFLNFIIDLELRNINKTPWDLTILYALSGNKQKALENLKYMCNANIDYKGMKVEPAFKSLRSDVRYIALLQKPGME
jgi:tetratricopeptide (TPR) repeat protein